MNLTLLEAASLSLSSCVGLLGFSFQFESTLDQEKNRAVSAVETTVDGYINVLVLHLHAVALGNGKCLDVVDTPLESFELLVFGTDECSDVRQGQIQGRPLSCYRHYPIEIVWEGVGGHFLRFLSEFHWILYMAQCQRRHAESVDLA